MNILVFRFSSLGDIVLVQPVIKGILESNAQIQITFVSRKDLQPLFTNVPNLKFIGGDFKKEHKGVRGLVKLYRQIRKEGNYDYIIDLHGVIRTRMLSFLFSLQGLRHITIDKGRKEKRRLTRKNDKVFRELKHTAQRYCDTFHKLGFKAERKEFSEIYIEPEVSNSVSKFLAEYELKEKKGCWIGIAPFSKHKQKEWPLAKIRHLIEKLTTDKNTTVFLFGGGTTEIKRLKTLEGSYENVMSMAGKLNLSQEISLLSQLDLMVTMDSFNMHLANIAGIKVISIWGATHSHAGFGPWGENMSNIVEIPHEELPCRPCSVFGNKPCWRQDHACMENITVNMVLDKINTHHFTEKVTQN